MISVEVSADTPVQEVPALIYQSIEQNTERVTRDIEGRSDFMSGANIARFVTVTTEVLYGYSPAVDPRIKTYTQQTTLWTVTGSAAYMQLFDLVAMRENNGMEYPDRWRRADAGMEYISSHMLRMIEEMVAAGTTPILRSGTANVASEQDSDFLLFVRNAIGKATTARHMTFDLMRLLLWFATVRWSEERNQIHLANVSRTRSMNVLLPENVIPFAWDRRPSGPLWPPRPQKRILRTLTSDRLER